MGSTCIPSPSLGDHSKAVGSPKQAVPPSAASPSAKKAAGTDHITLAQPDPATASNCDPKLTAFDTVMPKTLAAAVAVINQDYTIERNNLSTIHRYAKTEKAAVKTQIDAEVAADKSVEKSTIADVKSAIATAKAKWEAKIGLASYEGDEQAVVSAKAAEKKTTRGIRFAA